MPRRRGSRVGPKRVLPRTTATLAEMDPGIHRDAAAAASAYPRKSVPLRGHPTAISTAESTDLRGPAIPSQSNLLPAPWALRCP